jgi:hypothetical protein
VTKANSAENLMGGGPSNIISDAVTTTHEKIIA